METANQPTTIYYLEMLDRRALQSKQAPPGFEVSMVSPCSPALNRKFYESIGRQWGWAERVKWSDQDWCRYVNRPVLQTWVGRLNGQSVGYFELEAQADGNLEIVYFGLLSEFIGRGLGGPLLTAAIQRAWEIPNTRRVWVHTCTKDHPYALENYRGRGFDVYKTETA